MCSIAFLFWGGCAAIGEHRDDAGVSRGRDEEVLPKGYTTESDKKDIQHEQETKGRKPKELGADGY